MIIIRKMGQFGPFPKPYSTESCGQRLSFDFADSNGEQLLCAVVPDEHPSAAALRKIFGSIADYEIRETAPQPPPPPPPPVIIAVKGGETSITPIPPPNQEELLEGIHSHALVFVIATAERNGWSKEDLAGTGRLSDPSQHGGVSPRTGLHLAQMALCAPPPNWESKAATHYPWECEGFVSSNLLDWTPPIMPSKRPIEASPIIDEPAATTPTVPGEQPTEPKSTEPESTEFEDGDGADELGAYARALEAGRVEADEKDPAPDGTDPAVAAGYPAEHVHVARAIAHKLSAEGAGAGRPLYFGRVNHAIGAYNKQNATSLPPTNEAILVGLLAVPPEVKPTATPDAATAATETT